MYSLKELYRIGLGPSSSHTIGPFRACTIFLEKHPQADKFKITLLGSLALTGQGHFTDKAIYSVLGTEKTEIIWDNHIPKQHPNGMILEAYHNHTLLEKWEVFSIGGGSLVNKGDNFNLGASRFPHKNFTEIADYCTKNNLELWQYVDKFDEEDIWEYLEDIRRTMMSAIQEGLEQTGVLPAPMPYARRSALVYNNSINEINPSIRENGLLSAYALAVSEQNASMGKVVTAPTCGACGIMPAVLRYLQEVYHFDNQKILQALAVGGIIGLVAKHNASISGAEAGCQAEIGVGCSMAAGAVAFLLGYDLRHIENSAEVAMEHHLGMTCDPLGGYVIVPCIERNAAAAVRAVQSAYFVHLSHASNIIRYDEILQIMLDTGQDMNEDYKETSIGGLSKLYNKKLSEQNNNPISTDKGNC